MPETITETKQRLRGHIARLEAEADGLRFEVFILGTLAHAEVFSRLREIGDLLSDFRRAQAALMWRPQ